jgi:hypothetical protein
MTNFKEHWRVEKTLELLKHKIKLSGSRTDVEECVKYTMTWEIIAAWQTTETRMPYIRTDHDDVADDAPEGGINVITGRTIHAQGPIRDFEMSNGDIFDLKASRNHSQGAIHVQWGHIRLKASRSHSQGTIQESRFREIRQGKARKHG